MKKLYTVLNPIGHSGRLERGATVELTDEEAINYGPEYVALVTASKAKVEEVVEEVPLAKQTVAQLRITAEELGLETTGSKADLLERITLAQADAE